MNPCVSFPGRQHFTHHTSFLREFGTVHVTTLGEDNWKVVSGFSCTLPYVLFSMADFNLYTFITTSIIAFLNSLSPSSESWNMKLVLETPKTFPHYISFNNLNISFRSLLACMISEVNSDIFVIFVFLQVRCLFPLDSFRNFFFIFVFSNLKMTCLGVGVFSDIYPDLCSLSFLDL